MNLRLTKKLSDKLKYELVEIDDSKYSDVDNYHCNLLEFGGYDCLLITNTKTLYSFFIFDLDLDDFKYFEEFIRESIFKLLINSGLPQNKFEKVLESMKNINYSKTSNRSVIASMNEIKKAIEFELESSNDIFEINKYINEMIYKLTDYKQPSELFKEIL